MQVDVNFLLMITTKAILVAVFFFDVELRGWHVEDWCTVVGSSAMWQDAELSITAECCPVVICCNPRRIESYGMIV